MNNSVALNLIKLALTKRNDLDLINSIGNRECFENVCESEFLKAKKVLIIGAANINKIVKIIESVDKESKIVILESDESMYLNMAAELEVLEKETKHKNWDLYRCYWDNLKINQSLLEKYLGNTSVGKIKDYDNLNKYIERQCENNPLVSDGWADLVYVNAMNRFSKEFSDKILAQAFTLSQRYGEVLIDVILSDERATKYIQSSHEGIDYSYIPKEEEIVDILLKQSFHGINYAWRSELPIKVVDGVELRPFLIRGYKGKQGICMEKGHAVFYSGPWKEVIDDDGHKLVRGQRMAVCEKTYKVLTSAPYNNDVIGIEPYFTVPDTDASLFDCSIRPVRDPKITKGIKPLKSQKDDEDIMERSKCC